MSRSQLGTAIFLLYKDKNCALKWKRLLGGTEKVLKYRSLPPHLLSINNKIEWYEETEGDGETGPKCLRVKTLVHMELPHYLSPPPVAPLISVPVSVLFIPLFFSLSLLSLPGSLPFFLPAFHILFPSLLLPLPFFWAFVSPAPSSALTCVLLCLRCTLAPPLRLTSLASPVAPPMLLFIAVCLSSFLVPASLLIWRFLLPHLQLLFLLLFLLTSFFSVLSLAASGVWVWKTREKSAQVFSDAQLCPCVWQFKTLWFYKIKLIPLLYLSCCCCCWRSLNLTHWRSPRRSSHQMSWRTMRMMRRSQKIPPPGSESWSSLEHSSDVPSTHPWKRI